MRGLSHHSPASRGRDMAGIVQKMCAWPAGTLSYFSGDKGGDVTSAKCTFQAMSPLFPGPPRAGNIADMCINNNNNNNNNNKRYL